MNADQLFINLVFRLRRFPEAAVLWSLLRQRADEREYKTTALRMAYDRLDKTVDPKTAQRAFNSLQALGLIKIRIHKNKATLITVNREAVFDLLNVEPEDEFIEWMPGQGMAQESEIGFLHFWNERRRAQAEAKVAAKAGYGQGNPESATPAVSVIPTDPASESSRSMLEQSSDYDDH